MRRPQRWQFSLLGLLKLTTVVAVVLTLMVRRREIYEAVLGIGLRPGQVPEIDPPLAPLIWPIKVIILFGLGCTIYSLGTFAEFSARSLWKFARRDKETLPPG